MWLLFEATDIKFGLLFITISGHSGKDIRKIVGNTNRLDD